MRLSITALAIVRGSAAEPANIISFGTAVAAAGMHFARARRRPIAPCRRIEVLSIGVYP